jgi:hypothetical protein
LSDILSNKKYRLQKIQVLCLERKSAFVCAISFNGEVIRSESYGLGGLLYTSFVMQFQQSQNRTRKHHYDARETEKILAAILTEIVTSSQDSIT